MNIDLDLLSQLAIPHLIIMGAITFMAANQPGKFSIDTAIWFHHGRLRLQWYQKRQALTDQTWSEETVHTAMTALAEDYTPLADMRASADYRMASAQNLLLRYFHELNGADTSVLEVSA